VVIEGTDGKTYSFKITNQFAINSIRQAGWKFDPDSRALVLERGYGSVCVSLFAAEVAEFDILGRAVFMLESDYPDRLLP
jgi:hypothetical protein